MQGNNNSIMIFGIIRGGGVKLTGWGKNGPAYFFTGKKLTGGKFRPVTPVFSFIYCRVLIFALSLLYLLFHILIYML